MGGFGGDAVIGNGVGVQWQEVDEEVGGKQCERWTRR